MQSIRVFVRYSVYPANIFKYMYYGESLDTDAAGSEMLGTKYRLLIRCTPIQNRLGTLLKGTCRLHLAIITRSSSSWACTSFKLIT